MSMRQLATATGISVSTISKMIAGKQRVNLDYLRRIADVLGVPAIALAEAAGLTLNNASTGFSERDDHSSMNALLEYLGIENWSALRGEIERELEKYEAYAQTDEGQQLIAEKYPIKRGQIQGVGDFLHDLDEIYDQFTRPDTPEDERWILASGILYFLLATDAIPDYLFPTGYLDDAIAMQMVRERLARRRDMKIQGSDGSAGDGRKF
ncbi:helix-turn-helix domain-containing protein [Alicyclobacillus sendaiensis]|uniref:helix-turn-helix domain-containing protein n=1 Tax=Alicyclobacillus sendaiensis TaxID=192387 RepID=UPI001FDEAB87|nr:helix-turn-helix domain-containing protein [Alicyclobacillus sendaiensis]